MRIPERARRAIRATIAVAAVAAVAGTAAAHRSDTARAFADEQRANMAHAHKTTPAYRAVLEERELAGDGVYRTTIHRVFVAGPDRYRIELIERDEAGREVVSVTLRTGSTVYSLTRDATGSARMLELRNVPPTLGALTDNLLGQRVRDLAREGGMRYLGRDELRGRPALRLAAEPDHLVWIEPDRAMPLREQFLTDETVTREIEVLEYDPEPATDPAALDPASLEYATHTVEDLGFRPSSRADAPREQLGFVPRAFAAPSGWRLVDSGTILPVARGEGARDGGVWVELYETSEGPVLVSQTQAAPGADLAAGAGDGTTGPLLTQVDGRTVAYYADEWRTHATLHVDDVFVSVEGVLAPEAVLASTGGVR